MEKIAVYISSSVSSLRNIRDVVLELISLGVLNIELSGGTEYFEGLEDDLMYLKQKHRINFLIHNYFPPLLDNFVLNIASGEASIREKTLGFIRRAVNLAKKLGIGFYSLHPGFNKSFVYEAEGSFYEDSKNKAHRENTKEDFYQGIEALIDRVIKKENVKVAIENFFPYKGMYSFLDSQDDILSFLEYFRDESNVGLLLDLGHLNVAARILGFDKIAFVEKAINNYPEKLFEIHISENDSDRDAHRISPLDSWQIQLLRKNRKLIKAPVVFEWRKAGKSGFYQRFLELEREINDNQ